MSHEDKPYLLGLPTWPYPSAGTGYWSPVTSTINWCEEDYYASHYMAECVNSLTNLFFIYLGYIGINNCITQRHDKVILVAYGTYLAIGIGSFIFHSTLRYSMQLLDELSMVYTASVLFYATLEHGKSISTKIGLAVLTSAIAAFVTGYYIYLGDPVFHQNMFALMTAIVFGRCFYKMETTLRPSLPNGKDTGPHSAAQKERDQLNRWVLKNMRQMLPIGVGSIAVGFLIWNLDNIYCSNLIRWRRQIGLPWGILLEGHGWWHLFTSVAEFYNIFWCLWLRYCFDGKQGEFDLDWPSWWSSVPKLIRKKSKTEKMR